MDNSNNTTENQQDPTNKPDEKRIRTLNGKYKLGVFDWMKEIPDTGRQTKVVEVRFKNTRKDYFENVNDLPLEAGDIVAVEASPGHDIGVVSLTGDLVLLQIKKNNVARPKEGFRKIYRKARAVDIDKWNEAKALEDDTMIKARQISKDLKLDMKIGDVEYQGDKTKAIFYYIAEERVDFRELIKVLADKFKIRVEMRQIGARQEAGRIGGIGSCGKELCCSSFISKFVSVTTNAARYQELSLNPQKLAGQCGKLKCCLNFEVDSYIDAQKDFPSTNIPLYYKGGKATHSKTDVYKRTMWYFTETDSGNQFIGVPIERVKAIIKMNKAGEKPDTLIDEKDIKPIVKELDFDNVVGQESLTRFDEAPKKRRNNKRRNTKKPPHQRDDNKATTQKKQNPQNKAEAPKKQGDPNKPTSLNKRNNPKGGGANRPKKNNANQPNNNRRRNNNNNNRNAQNKPKNNQ